MRIALVNDIVYGYAVGDPSAVGGAERYQWLLTRALAAYGWSPVVGVRTALRPGTRVRIEGVEFVGMPRGQFLKSLYEFLSAERPDWCFWVASTHLLGPAVGIARVAGARSVYCAQFDLDVRPREALTRRRRLWPLYALGLIGAGKIFLQHTGQYAELPARWKSKAYVIPGVVNIPESIKPHVERGRYVAWVGVLRQPKRPDLLVDIARRLPSIEFVVCGGTSAHRSPPGYGARIVEQLETLPNVRYLGQVAPDRALEIISDAALLLSTSEGEGFPSVFVEAWAHGTPVATLRIDPDRLIARKGLGVVCESVEGAAREVGTLVDSVERREAIAVRARSYAIQSHSGAAVAPIVDRAMKTDPAPVLQPYESVGSS
jgi:glycosyltransferase involved in cell wall biosynthesis